MKLFFVVGAALLAGFLGGVLGTLAMGTREQSQPQKVIRARTFELVDEAGHPISYWGVDKGENVVLAFGCRRDVKAAGRGVLPGHPPLGLDDPHNQLAAIGLQGNDSPILKMSAADGKTRVRLLLSVDGKPVLLMEDETGPRVSLGIQQSDTPGPSDNDWGLDFGPDRARIGMFARKEAGETYVRGLFSVNRDKVKYPYQQQK